MGSSRKKLKIVNPKKLVIASAAVLAIIVLLISLVSGMLFGGDKIQKAIEKTEGKDVVITDRRFSSTTPDESVVHLGDVIAFKLVYCYQTEDAMLKSYEVTEDIIVTIDGDSEENPSQVAKVTDNTIQILNTAKMNDDVTVTISHKYMEDVTYTYTVGTTEVIE